VTETSTSKKPEVPKSMLTQVDIRTALESMDLQPSMTVLVHCSMSKLGWINGGVQALAGGILGVLGPTGTLMVPTHTPTHTEPSFWPNPPVPEEWWEAIRQTRPAFDPDLTPSQYMGALAEFVRTHPKSHRSEHPAG
jgi:aminoglycoside 3-N-acetyltransferase